jgi:precorrin-2 dehydrogenase / sirohydrochlorin ferrochelatase
MNHLYPVMLDLTGRSVLVVGGGVIGFRKAEGLVAAGAKLTAISPVFAPEWNTFGDSVTRHTRTYESNDLAGYWLVITATNDRAAQQQVFDDGERLGIWVNAADDPDRCAFILPAVHRDGPVILSVSTSGSAPALAGWLRDRAAAALPENTAELATQLRAERDEIHATGATTEGLNWRDRIETLTRPDQ